MRITSFYYLQYPDCSPSDPLIASSEVYVEVGNENGSLSSFESTYSFMVVTEQFIKSYLETHPFYVQRAVIVVKRFEDSIIKAALESILPNISVFGIRK